MSFSACVKNVYVKQCSKSKLSRVKKNVAHKKIHNFNFFWSLITENVVCFMNIQKYFKPLSSKRAQSDKQKITAWSCGHCHLPHFPWKAIKRWLVWWGSFFMVATWRNAQWRGNLLAKTSLHLFIQEGKSRWCQSPPNMMNGGTQHNYSINFLCCCCWKGCVISLFCMHVPSSFFCAEKQWYQSAWAAACNRCCIFVKK